jgi:hypothetical protein
MMINWFYGDYFLLLLLESDKSLRKAIFQKMGVSGGAKN